MHSLLVPFLQYHLVGFNDVFLFSDDFNRVVLDTIEGEHDSDYINASYVDVSTFLHYKIGSNVTFESVLDKCSLKIAQ